MIAQRTDLMRDLKAAEADWLQQHEHLDAMIAATALDAIGTPTRRPALQSARGGLLVDRRLFLRFFRNAPTQRRKHRNFCVA